MSTVLITGASRGIGREFVRQFADDNWSVIACCRNPDQAGDLAGRTNVEIHRLDVDDGSSVDAARAVVGDRPIDVLINNAGIVGQRSGFGNLDYTAWAAAMNTNVFGCMRVAEQFADNVLASRRRQMVFVTSRMGSIAEASPNAYVYRSSKAALNMAVRCLSLEYAAHGLVAILLHPGHVRTDMGGSAAPVTPERSVAGMKRRIEALAPADNGRFYSYDGREIPW